MQRAVRALHEIQRQINNALAVPGSATDHSLSSPAPYEPQPPYLRFGQPITQAYRPTSQGKPVWVLLLGRDPVPIFTSDRPITIDDFRAPDGPVQQALTRAGRDRGLTEPTTGATQAVAQAASPGTPGSASWTGRPPQRQEDLNFSFFDEQTGQTVTVTQPLWKDDNWNLGGYFTVGLNGVRRGINGWSPAAASGANAREVVLELLNEGLIDPRNVTSMQTHERQFGGDGGQYWIPTRRQTYQDGMALYHAQRAAQIPTDSSVTIRPNDNPDFARGYRDAGVNVEDTSEQASGCLT